MKRFVLLVSVLLLIATLVPLNTPTRITHAQDDDSVVTIKIINTSDEHGWLQPFTPFGSEMVQGGAANIFAWWQAVESYDPATTLLLSGGDNWTGPAISTWFEGTPMVEAMNMMGYDASAIGNHEFDFGREVMEERFTEAEFPYLAANVRYADSGDQVAFAEPYAIFEVNGVQVGVIGLTTVATATTTHPKNIGDLEFIDYATALEEYVPDMRTDGAQIIIGLTHACSNELDALMQSHGDMLDAVFTGHCNQQLATEINDVPLVGSGAYWRSYAVLEMEFDTSTGEILSYDARFVDVEFDPAEGNPVTPVAELVELVDVWQGEVDLELAEPVGYSETGLDQRSHIQGNWVTDAWLWAYPNADVAINNWGGLRAPVDAGEVTVGDVVAVLPFDNVLVAVDLTGEELLENLECCGGSLGGMTYFDGEITLLDGREFSLDETYTVLVNDFMYFGGDGYLFSEQNPEGYNTGIQWRQPVIDYTESLASGEENPLETMLDAEPRSAFEAAE
jgi:2',3'-cyclic-nucleotide 2'-phosphodiesterase (5'-nucleotidase family)